MSSPPVRAPRTRAPVPYDAQAHFQELAQLRAEQRHRYGKDLERCGPHLARALQILWGPHGDVVVPPYGWPLAHHYWPGGDTLKKIKISACIGQVLESSILKPCKGA